jgi:DNA-directed RNA polymerase
MATEKKTIKVKEVISDDSIYGYLGGAVTITPPSLAERKVPKAKQFSVDIEPLSDEDCTTINSLNRSQQLLMSLWYVSEDGKKFTDANTKLAKFNGDNADFTAEDFKSVQLRETQMAKVNNDSQKFATVQKVITNLQKHPLASDGVIDDLAWQRMRKQDKEFIYNSIIDMSMLSESDAINLQ